LGYLLPTFKFFDFPVLLHDEGVVCTKLDVYVLMKHLISLSIVLLEFCQ